MQLTTAIQELYCKKRSEKTHLMLQYYQSNYSQNPSPSKNVCSFQQVLKESKFIALHISLFALIFQYAKGRSVRMLHFVSSILDLYFTVCLICSKSCFWFPQDSHSTWGKATKSRKRTKGFTLVSRVVSPRAAVTTYTTAYSQEG